MLRTAVSADKGTPRSEAGPVPAVSVSAGRRNRKGLRDTPR
jgi:hypothetical protein